MLKTTAVVAMKIYRYHFDYKLYLPSLIIGEN